MQLQWPGPHTRRPPPNPTPSEFPARPVMPGPRVSADVSRGATFPLGRAWDPGWAPAGVVAATA